MIDTLYFVGVVDKDGNSDTIGYFERLEDAKIRVEANQFDMHEDGMYPYAVIEEVGSNCLYPHSELKCFYTWTKDKYVLTPIPKEFDSYCNFTVR